MFVVVMAPSYFLTTRSLCVTNMLSHNHPNTINTLQRRAVGCATGESAATRRIALEASLCIAAWNKAII